MNIESEVMKMKDFYGKEHFWVVVVKYDKTEVGVSQTIYREFKNAKDFVMNRGGNLKELGDFITYDTENGIEYEIKDVEVGD